MDLINIKGSKSRRLQLQFAIQLLFVVSGSQCYPEQTAYEGLLLHVYMDKSKHTNTLLNTEKVLFAQRRKENLISNFSKI